MAIISYKHELLQTPVRQTDKQRQSRTNEEKRSRKSPLNCCKILNSFILAPHVCHVSQLKFYLWNRSDIKYEINYQLKYAAKELSDSQRLQSRNELWQSVDTCNDDDTGHKHRLWLELNVCQYFFDLLAENICDDPREIQMRVVRIPLL